MIVRYFVAGRQLMADTEHPAPRKGDERRIDGRWWEADRVITCIEDCPPDEVWVLLKMVQPPEIWPLGHP